MLNNCFRHDFDATHGGQRGPCNNQGLMSYGDKPDKWSTCSNTDFAAWFRREGNVCLKSKSSGIGMELLYIYTIPVFPGGSDLMNTSQISNLLGKEGPKTVFIGPT